jgi:hypothetical protein
MEEKYPPGIRVEQIDPSTNILITGTVMDIPISQTRTKSLAEPNYTILFDIGTTSSVLCQKWPASFLLLQCGRTPQLAAIISFLLSSS